MNEYGENVMDHFTNPRNVGEMADADGVGTIGNPICGDIMRVYIKVKDDRIADIRFKTFGCAAAISSGSVLTELVKGKTIEEALAVGRDRIVEELGGLPSRKRHCSVLAQDALKKAVEDYRNRKNSVAVRFVLDEGALRGYLLKTPLGTRIIEALPLDAEVATWGEELYFPIGIKASLSEPQLEMEAGDVAFWPDEGALCLFWGPTPASEGVEIRAYSHVELVGRFEVNRKLLDGVANGARVMVERA